MILSLLYWWEWLAKVFLARCMVLGRPKLFRCHFYESPSIIRLLPNCPYYYQLVEWIRGCANRPKKCRKIEKSKSSLFHKNLVLNKIGLPFHLSTMQPKNIVCNHFCAYCCLVSFPFWCWILSPHIVKWYGYWICINHIFHIPVGQ